MSEVLNYVMELIRTSGSLGVMVGVLIESVLAPIPSPIIIMGAGFIMLPQGLSILEVLPSLILMITLPGAVATTIGSFIGYGIGYAGGKPLIERMDWLLGVDWNELNKGLEYFQKGVKDEVIIFLMRALPIIPLSVFSAVAGVLRIPVKKFSIYTFLGALVRVFTLGLSGWLLGAAYNELAEKVNFLENIGLVLIGGFLIILFFAVYKRVNSSKS